PRVLRQDAEPAFLVSQARAEARIRNRLSRAARGRGLLRAERPRRDDARRQAVRRDAGHGDSDAHRQLARPRAGRSGGSRPHHHLRDQVIAFDRERRPEDLLPSIERLFDLSAQKIKAIERTWHPADGAPVFTVEGRYRARGWTEWTQGFQFGAA